MNISQVIDNVKRLKSGYDISDEQIIADINRVEMNIIHNIVSGRVGDEEIIANFGNYDINTPSDKELIAPAPYDTIYQEFCCSQIDLQYEDSERYQNDSIIYNNTLTLLKGFWYRTHPQKKEHQYNKKICFGSNIGKSNIAGITLEQLKNELKSYLTKLEIQSELSKKENLSNKVTEFDAQFKDDSNDTYPTVNAVIEYLSAYYYTYDEILAILNSMKLDEDGNLTIEVDGEKTVIGQFNIQNGKSAYEIAVDNGFAGTVEEWLESLKGERGTDGINGIDGQNGTDGIGITSTEINASGELVLTYSDGSTANVGVVVGAKGDKGDTGTDGQDYVLTDTDKTEIANIAIDNIADGDEVKY